MTQLIFTLLTQLWSGWVPDSVRTGEDKIAMKTTQTAPSQKTIPEIKFSHISLLYHHDVKSPVLPSVYSRKVNINKR